MVKVKYDGGIQQITVVLPTRPLQVTAGDTVEVSADEADLLCVLDGFARVKSPKTSTKESN